LLTYSRPAITLARLNLWLWLQLLLLSSDFDVLVLDVKAQPPEQAHIHIGNPDKSKPADEISPPILVQQLVTSDYQKKNRHVVTETVLTREQIKEFSLKEPLAGFAVICTPLSRLSEDFLMGHRPGDGRNGDREHEEGNNLVAKWHVFTAEYAGFGAQHRLFTFGV
jgi:hypothetical protein